MYCFAIKTLFRKIPVELHKPPSPKEKHQLLLHDIGGGCYMNKLSEKLPPLNKRKQIIKAQEKEDGICKNNRNIHFHSAAPVIKYH